MTKITCGRFLVNKHWPYFSLESSANRLHVVTVVDPADENSSTIATLANDAGIAGHRDGAATAARFRNPTGLYLDATARILYVADTGNHVVRAINLLNGVAAATVAGTPQVLGFFGDDGAATSALLYQPQAITRCPSGDLFLADTGNHRVRRLAAGTGLITTVLGDGIAASSGEGAPADTFPVNTPLGLACDGFGNLFVTSSTTVRLLRADDAGLVDGTGPVQTIFGAPPRITFPAAISLCALLHLRRADALALQRRVRVPVRDPRSRSAARQASLHGGTGAWRRRPDEPEIPAATWLPRETRSAGINRDQLG